LRLARLIVGDGWTYTTAAAILLWTSATRQRLRVASGSHVSAQAASDAYEQLRGPLANYG
jgi:hypothetical protein